MPLNEHEFISLVKLYREGTGCSLIEAAKAVNKRILLEDLAKAELKDIIRRIIT